MKIIFIVIDGLGDDSVPELGNKTPLEAANTPNMDWLARNGIYGKLKQVFVGESPDSDETHFSLFGYDPNQYLVGRGVFEALGIGFKLKSNDVALRANLGTVNDNL
jgi:2,3-bisphosphoglycerate-independent phosphoglycerate mutase